MNEQTHTHPHNARSGRLSTALLAGLLLLLAACGGAPADTSTAETSASASGNGDSPTSAPAANAGGPATIGIPTFEFVQPTVTIAVTARPEATAEATESAAEVVALDPQAVERGQGRYVALECGSCHGDAGEGTEEGSSLLDFAMSEVDFISFMRSGGELGADHQYSTNRLTATRGKPDRAGAHGHAQRLSQPG
ncbi:MAG: hypothetical protein IPK19_28885 [Chloroflexi bacterium]|nr:hypothetical protein [Chloroflexota bacterium]